MLTVSADHRSVRLKTVGSRYSRLILRLSMDTGGSITSKAILRPPYAAPILSNCKKVDVQLTCLLSVLLLCRGMESDTEAHDRQHKNSK